MSRWSPPPTEVVVTGYMLVGPDMDEARRGWFIHADPAPGREAVTVTRKVKS